MSQVLLEGPTSQLAALVEQARRGEEVVILRDSTPVARLVALPEAESEERRGGFGSGRYALIHMADDFDAPLEDFKGYM